jgi:hypothetical protein
MREPGRKTKPRKKPAYPKPGSGAEDFPNRRPGSKVGETSSGHKVLQPTRGTQRRRVQRSLERQNRGGIYNLIPPPLRKKSSSFKVEVGPNRMGKAWDMHPDDRQVPISVDSRPTARRVRGRRV